MTKITIKDLQQGLKRAIESSEFWEKQAEKADKQMKENCELYKKMIDEVAAGKFAEGQYQGFKEATQLFKRTEAGEKYEIDQRIKFAERREARKHQQY